MSAWRNYATFTLSILLFEFILIVVFRWNLNKDDDMIGNAECGVKVCVRVCCDEECLFDNETIADLSESRNLPKDFEFLRENPNCIEMYVEPNDVPTDSWAFSKVIFSNNKFENIFQSFCFEEWIGCDNI